MALRDVLIAPRAGDVEGGSLVRRGRVRMIRRSDRSVANEVAPSLGVLAPAREVRAVAMAVGLVIARLHPAALVCVHAPGDEPARASLRAPARAAAARLAGSLRGRGVHSDARGKVVLVEVAGDEAAMATGDAAAAAERALAVTCDAAAEVAGDEAAMATGDSAAAAARALAAAGPLPTVLAVGARDPDLDVLLAAQDAILIALPPSAEPALAELAVASARSLASNAAWVSLALDPVARTFALAGLRTPGAVRAAVEGLLT